MAIVHGRKNMVDKLIEKGIDIGILDVENSWQDSDSNLVSYFLSKLKQRNSCQAPLIVGEINKIRFFMYGVKKM